MRMNAWITMTAIQKQFAVIQSAVTHVNAGKDGLAMDDNVKVNLFA